MRRTLVRRAAPAGLAYVLVAVLMGALAGTVLGNALSHLIEAGLREVTPGLVIAIRAGYPVVLWMRVHWAPLLRCEPSAVVVEPVADVSAIDQDCAPVAVEVAVVKPFKISAPEVERSWSVRSRQTSRTWLRKSGPRRWASIPSSRLSLLVTATNRPGKPLPDRGDDGDLTTPRCSPTASGSAPGPCCEVAVDPVAQRHRRAGPTHPLGSSA